MACREEEREGLPRKERSASILSLQKEMKPVIVLEIQGKKGEG